jgi:EAL and modified HD-GYP domain-containing signal transduction protein
MQNIFIARQPIYNGQLGVIGYELLYRASDTDSARFTNGDEASSQVIINSFINIGIERLVGSSLAFINIPAQLVLNDTLLPMFHEQTVLEIQNDTMPTPEVIAGLRRLKTRGFKIALDDFVYQPAFRPLLELADFIKLNMQSMRRDAINDQLTQLLPYPVTLVAEKVQTEEMYALCKAYGFRYFQGYFFCRPRTLTEKTLAPNKAVVLALLQQLNDPALDMRDLEKTLAVDVTLSYKLLRYVNSAAFSMRREIESLKDAIVLVGLDTIRNWATLILLGSINTGRPKELIKVAMIRARMCELLAENQNPAIKPQMFIVGLLSVLDVIMEMSMANLLDHLALSAPIKFALMNQEGAHGALLKQTMLYEQGQWDELLSTGLDRKAVVSAYLEAVRWADASIDALLD